VINLLHAQTPTGLQLQIPVLSCLIARPLVLSRGSCICYPWLVLACANPGSRLWLVCPILCNAAGHHHVVAAAVGGSSSDACRRHSVCLCLYFCLCLFYFTAAAIAVCFFLFSSFLILVQRYRHLRALCWFALAVAWNRLGTRQSQSPPRNGPRAASFER
jgi:hypothetical protein